MTDKKKLTTRNGAPVVDNQNIMTAGPRGPALLQDVWFLEKLAHFDREVIPERRMHAKGSGAHGTFTVTHDITRHTKAKIFSKVGKKTEIFAQFSTVAGERGAADAERDSSMRVVDGNYGSLLGYEPNSYGEWQQQPEYAEHPLALEGAADHWNFREDDDD